MSAALRGPVDGGALAPAAQAAAPAQAGDFRAWAGARARRVESALDAVLAPADEPPQALHAAMRYASLGGGKRVRPLLVYAAGELSGAPDPLLDRAACAVELIHAYSLVHDDLPCMDDDVLRRGKPTAHVAFGEAMALLAADALQALAFEALVRPPAPLPAPATVGEWVATLAHAAGSRGMCGGQAIDLSAVGQRLGREALEDMHRRKTGALLRASVLMGACAAGPIAAATRAALEAYGEAIGLAFQVIDDVLDVEADSATLGKTAGKDASRSKPTYVSTIGLEASRALAGELHARALAALAPLGPAAIRLRELADLVVLRTS